MPEITEAQRTPTSTVADSATSIDICFASVFRAILYTSFFQVHAEILYTEMLFITKDSAAKTTAIGSSSSVLLFYNTSCRAVAAAKIPRETMTMSTSTEAYALYR